MYYDILRIVEEVIGVTAKEMLTSNAEENVDADTYLCMYWVIVVSLITKLRN